MPVSGGGVIAGGGGGSSKIMQLLQVLQAQEQLDLAKKNQVFMEANAARDDALAQFDEEMKQFPSSKVWGAMNPEKAKVRYALISNGDQAKAQKMYQEELSREATPDEQAWVQAHMASSGYVTRNGQPFNFAPQGNLEFARDATGRSPTPGGTPAAPQPAPQVGEVSAGLRAGQAAPVGPTPLSTLEAGGSGLKAALDRRLAAGQPVPQGSTALDRPSGPQTVPIEEATAGLARRGMVSEAPARGQLRTEVPPGQIDQAQAEIRGAPAEHVPVGAELVQAQEVPKAAAAPAAAPAPAGDQLGSGNASLEQTLGELSKLSAEEMAKARALADQLAIGAGDTMTNLEKKMAADYTEAQKRTVYQLRRDLSPEQRERLRAFGVNGDVMAQRLTDLAQTPPEQMDAVSRMFVPASVGQARKDDLARAETLAKMGVDVAQMDAQMKSAALQGYLGLAQDYIETIRAALSAAGTDDPMKRLVDMFDSVGRQLASADELGVKQFGDKWPEKRDEFLTDSKSVYGKLNSAWTVLAEQLGLGTAESLKVMVKDLWNIHGLTGGPLSKIISGAMNWLVPKAPKEVNVPGLRSAASGAGATPEQERSAGLDYAAEMMKQEQ